MAAKAKAKPAASATVAAATSNARSVSRQHERIDMLCNEVGIGSRLSRNDWVSQRVGRTVRFLDELTSNEAGYLIRELLSMKSDTFKHDRANANIGEGDADSDNTPEAERQLCSECGGVGTTCYLCGQPKQECLKSSRAHRYEPVKCASCDGKRFELA